jgi:hypothetical protein
VPGFSKQHTEKEQLKKGGIFSCHADPVTDQKIPQHQVEEEWQEPGVRQPVFPAALEEDPGSEQGQEKVDQP